MAEEWIKWLAGMGIAALIWFVRLEGNLRGHEKECAQRQKNLDERHDTMTRTLQDISGKLDRLVEGR